MEHFIEPDRSLETLEDPAAKLGVPTFSEYRAAMSSVPFVGRDPTFDDFLRRSLAVNLRCEDQCSAQYYFDLWSALRVYRGGLRHIVEVGVYMGGCSVLLAEYIAQNDCTLDLVDIQSSNLQFTYEHIRRQRPDAIHKVRLFRGDFPSYVCHVLQHEDAGKTFVHHDGSHDFNQVIKDLSALYYVRDKVTAIAIQDTHLRGLPPTMNFVDAALYAVFGLQPTYVAIGAVYKETAQEMVNPNRYNGNYFMPGVAEGWILPLALNNFQYPHPRLKLEDFLNQG